MPGPQTHSTLSLYTLICSMLMQAGIIILLVAQSFAAPYQHIIFAVGLCILGAGFLCCISPLLWNIVCRVHAIHHLKPAAADKAGWDKRYEAPGSNKPDASSYKHSESDVL